MALSRSSAVVAAAFAVSGYVHLKHPEVFEPVMPSWLPKHRELILASGVAEIACAAGMAVPATRKPAALASTALLVAVYPANVKMAKDSVARGSRGDRRLQVATVLRLPMQWPMIRSTWRTFRGLDG
ncbi:DoxX family protein [Nocardioides bruguierae]|uniref:DoxX family protein n=1 Tax=Nocardioides bruguierae TaxID=2945102 RepID=A0A9X2D7Q0_9ACTN|nr:DoxX family protein [Nocardioides bruguierae]MCL8027113.1 DoxX family protein [Nocardioides bruguierae]MCM0619604.1 DoxX family protein [Nocardioides bruguierae]